MCPRGCRGIGVRRASSHSLPTTFESGKSPDLPETKVEDDPLDRWHLAPIAVIGLDHQLHAGLEADKAIRPQPHRVSLKALLAYLREIFFRDHPGRPRGQGAIEGQEVGPGGMENEAD